jgi:hypothetical protein
MAITGQLTVDWADGKTEAWAAGTNSGTHKFAENGFYRVQVRDEGGNYGYVDIDVVIEPKISSIPKTLDADVLLTDPDTGALYFSLPVKGLHLDPTHVQFAVVGPNHSGLVPESLWHYISEPLDPAKAGKEALLKIPKDDLAGYSDFQVVFRYYVSTGYPYVTWHQLPTTSKVTALSKTGEFSADFGDEFNKRTK